MRKFLAVAMSIALIVPVQAFAGDCRATSYNHHAYVAPVYHHQQAYNQHHQVYDHHNQIIVAKAFQVQVAAPFYLGIADDVRQLNFAKQVAEELAKINELQRQSLNLGSAPQSLPVSAAKPTSKIGAILASRCAGCHSPGTQEPDLSGNPDAIPEIVRLKSFAATARGDMPRGKPAIPQDEFNEIGAWSKLKPNGLVPQVPALPVPPAIPAAKEPAKEAGLIEPKEAKK